MDGGARSLFAAASVMIDCDVAAAVTSLTVAIGHVAVRQCAAASIS